MARDSSVLASTIVSKLTEKGLFEPTSGHGQAFADAIAAAVCAYLDDSVDTIYNSHTHICAAPGSASGAPNAPMGGA